MSNLVTASRDFSTVEIELIKRTIAPSASAQEFDLFLYRCRHMGLDPLRPGEIYFIKYGTSPGTIVVGLEGFRKRAERSGKRSGIKRGVLRDDSGKCIGAWCEVYRSDWTAPAREEVSLAEYDTGRSLWAKMPETMIKKVAEAAALRLAFPDECGGLYIKEEMDQAEGGRDVSPEIDVDANPWSYTLPITWSRNGGASLESLGLDGVNNVLSWLAGLERKEKLSPKNEEVKAACLRALESPPKSQAEVELDNELDKALAGDRS